MKSGESPELFPDSFFIGNNRCGFSRRGAENAEISCLLETV
jgi:hypothetical protein